MLGGKWLRSTWGWDRNTPLIACTGTRADLSRSLNARDVEPRWSSTVGAPTLPVTATSTPPPQNPSQNAAAPYLPEPESPTSQTETFSTHSWSPSKRDGSQNKRCCVVWEPSRIACVRHRVAFTPHLFAFVPHLFACVRPRRVFERQVGCLCRAPSRFCSAPTCLRSMAVTSTKQPGTHLNLPGTPKRVPVSRNAFLLFKLDTVWTDRDYGVGSGWGSSAAERRWIRLYCRDFEP